MQIMGYSFIILKHIQIHSQFWNLLILKIWLQFFLGGGGTNGRSLGGGKGIQAMLTFK